MDSHERERFGAELRRLRDRAGLSLGELAGLAHVNRGYVGHIEHGQRWPSQRIVEALDTALQARRALLELWNTAEASRLTASVRTVVDPVDVDELAAIELARRVVASDLGAETLARLEAAVDDLATAYPVTAPRELLAAAAEDYAREIIFRLRDDGNGSRWPRRVASANIDLALALLATERLDEAAASVLAAMRSGMVVPSNHWRALEVIRAIEDRGLPEGRELRDAYEQIRRTATVAAGS